MQHQANKQQNQHVQHTRFRYVLCTDTAGLDATIHALRRHQPYAWARSLMFRLIRGRDARLRDSGLHGCFADAAGSVRAEEAGARSVPSA